MSGGASARELQDVLTLAERVAACRDLQAFRHAVADTVHDLFETGLVVLVEGQGPAAQVRLFDAARVEQREFLARHPEIAREQIGVMLEPPVPAGTAARQVLPQIERDTRATIQISWPAYAIEDAVFASFANASGYFGMLAIALADGSPQVVDRASRFVLASHGFLGATLDNLLRQEQVLGRQAALEALVDEQHAAFLVGAGGVLSWCSARARALFARLTGDETPPADVLRACAALLAQGGVAWQAPERRRVGGRLLLLRYQQVPAGDRRQVLVTVEDPQAERVANLIERARSLGLSAREAQVASLVAHGLANKEIALRLNIREQTVKNHLKRIFARVATRSRTELARLLLS